ncbi:MAG: SMC-Scp complex subunit ScpB [Clostridiales bacterium]|nr:SMC-Scp complex subunit ScpB [Clostridiales bacterium]
MMKDREFKNTIEAILFACGDEVRVDRIAAVLGINVDRTEQLIEELSQEYLGENRGIVIRRMKNTVQMSTNQNYYEKVRLLFEKNDTRNLSQAAYETLAVIAYNKEATRAKIESVRGVGCGSSISTLLDRELIEEAGRLDAPGRPVVFRPSMEFYRAFGFKTLDDLIPIELPSDSEPEPGSQINLDDFTEPEMPGSMPEGTEI